jgi:subtilisin family serine protease
VREASRNWHLLDATSDGVAGISAEKALRELIANRPPRRTVVVAVIDGGVDTAHVDLIANLWSNAKETAGNSRDDDSNGYIDDVRGWNFIGGKDGRNVHHDTYEVARLHALCTNAGPAGETLPSALRPQCDRIARDFTQDKQEAEATLQQIQMINSALSRAVPMLKQATGSDSLTVERVAALRPASPQVEQAKQIYVQLAANGLTQDEVEEALKAYDSRVKYGLDPAYNPRPIVGDKYSDTSEKTYGNRDVTGPDAGHGTHVAGIIAAVRGNNQGIDGIAPARIMTIRTVPDGDERDKDVANAIRYAVDNGAQIINMSFGKAYSPYKSAVDEAVKYADSRGVLMIHAAGNDGEDLDQSPSYPTATYEGGGRAANWIEVGASSWKSADSLAAPFSNYSRQRVDVFAPGVDILSTVPGGGYEQESGTSMAAPVVSGLAALIMSYYSELTAADVKRIILESATKRGQQMVIKPGTDGEKVPFASLSATGGIVNAFAALQMAEQMSRAAR